jgi:hypothetical protein
MCKDTLDGGHHAVAGCRKIVSTIGACRHNAAGRLILKAIATGQYGASLLAADVGRRELMETEGLRDLAWGLPAWLKPPEELHTPWPSRPDGTLILAKNNCERDVHLLTTQQVTQDSSILLLEIKYCADYKQQEKVLACVEQHRLTVQLLKGWYPGAKVEVVPLVLGTGGSIFTDFKRQMERLGVKGNAYTKLANKLNDSAAEYVDRAMKARWAAGHGGRDGESGLRTDRIPDG